MTQQVTMFTLEKVPICNFIGVKDNKALLSIDGELKIVPVRMIFGQKEDGGMIMLTELIEEGIIPEIVDHVGNTIFKRVDWNEETVTRIFKDITSIDGVEL